MNKVPPMSEKSRQRLAKTAECVSDYMDEGLEPAEAVAKAARNNNLPPEHIPLLCQSTNIASLEAQRLTGSTTAEKSASVPVVRAEDAVSLLFGQTEKVASADPISEDYEESPYWLQPSLRTGFTTKWSGYGRETRNHNPEKKISKIDQALIARNKEARLKTQLEKAGQVFCNTLNQLKKAIEIAPFGTYADTVRDAPILYGEVASALVSQATAGIADRVKKASAIHEPVNIDSPVYSAIRSAIEQIDPICELQSQVKAATEQRKQLEVDAELVHENVCKNQQGLLLEKDALWEGLGAAGVTAGMLYNKMKGDVTDPAKTATPGDVKTMAEMRNAQISATLGNAIVNDEVLSKAPREEIFHHYNQLAALGPLAMSDPSTASAILRKRIEGGKNAIDPYEIDLLLKIDRSLRDRYRPIEQQNEQK
jgi:hypothetical protein